MPASSRPDRLLRKSATPDHYKATCRRDTVNSPGGTGGAQNASSPCPIELVFVGATRGISSASSLRAQGAGGARRPVSLPLRNERVLRSGDVLSPRLLPRAQRTFPAGPTSNAIPESSCRSLSSCQSQLDRRRFATLRWRPSAAFRFGRETSLPRPQTEELVGGS